MEGECSAKIVQVLKDKGEYIEPTEKEIREDLQSYIYDEYKSVHGIKGRFFDYDAMSIEEMRTVADGLQEQVVIDIATERAEDIQYQDKLKQAKEIKGAIISKNPEFDEEYSKPNSDLDYGRNRRYNIYIPNEEDTPKNSLESAFKKAKKLKMK